MVVFLKLTTNVQEILDDYRRKVRKLDTGSAKYLNLTAETGKKVAYGLAAKKSGRTARAIKVSKAGGKRKVATVIASNGHPYKTWKGEKFNLTYWMHKSDRAPGHIRTGEPRFMYRAGEITKKELGKNFRKLISGL